MLECFWTLLARLSFRSKTSIVNLAGKLSFSHNVYICIFELVWMMFFSIFAQLFSTFLDITFHHQINIQSIVRLWKPFWIMLFPSWTDMTWSLSFALHKTLATSGILTFIHVLRWCDQVIISLAQNCCYNRNIFRLLFFMVDVTK